MNKNFSKFLIILIIALALEVIVFNITSYRIFLGNFECKSYDINNIEYYKKENEKVFLELNNINTKVGTVKLELRDMDEVTEYQVYFCDEASQEFQSLPSKRYIQDCEKSKYIPLYLSGNTSKILIAVDKEIYENGNLERVIINGKIPFDFNLVRFGITAVILVFLYFMKYGETLNQEYSQKNLKQEIILLAVLAVFFIILSWINVYSTNSEELNFYSTDFVDSILKGKLYLSKPSEKFLNLENPYDAFSRHGVERDKDYIWDTAYYEGKQYVYFGILPLLISFLPYYLIFKKYLSIPIVIFIFSVFIFILLKEILLKLLNMFFKDVHFKVVLYLLIILCSGTLIIYANGIPRVYELVILAGVYFVLQGIFFILKSYEDEKNKYKNIFLGSLFLALSVACRPTDLFASILIVPYLINLFIENIKKFKENKNPLLKLILAVGIPYLIVGVTLMWYNYARFGNVFEFGTKYQITIYNMVSIGSREFVWPVGVATNLFSIPNFILQFPFITNHNNLITFYGYYYIENMIGGVFMLAPICFLNFLIIKLNRKCENKHLKIIINSLLFIGSFIAIISSMMAGSNQRYLIDYAWMLILSGILIFMWLYKYFKTEEAKKILQTFLAIITVYTFLLRNYRRNCFRKKLHGKMFS